MNDRARGMILFLGIAAFVCFGAYRLLHWRSSKIPWDAWYHPANLRAAGYPRPVLPARD